MKEHYRPQLDDTLLPENGSRDILYIIRYLLSLYDNGSRVEDKRKVKTYFQILKVALRETGETVLRHLIRHEACTAFELHETYDMSYSTACRILKLLEYGELVRRVGFVGRPYYNIGDGRQVKIYVLLDADPSAATQAQVRYGEIKQSKRIDPMRQTQLEEAFNLVKLYLDERETKHIPPQIHILQILKENEIKGVNYNLLLRTLTRSGYKL